MDFEYVCCDWMLSVCRVMKCCVKINFQQY